MTMQHVKRHLDAAGSRSLDLEDRLGHIGVADERGIRGVEDHD